MFEARLVHPSACDLQHINLRTKQAFGEWVILSTKAGPQMALWKVDLTHAAVGEVFFAICTMPNCVLSEGSRQRIYFRIRYKDS